MYTDLITISLNRDLISEPMTAYQYIITGSTSFNITKCALKNTE